LAGNSILHLKDENALKELLARMKSGKPADNLFSPPPVSNNKFHAIMTEVDGMKFQSKKESRYYLELKARVHLGEVKYFLRQIPILLPGGVKYVVDFVEFLTDGSVRYVDVKGCRTDVYKVKKKLVEATYPIKIIEA